MRSISELSTVRAIDPGAIARAWAGRTRRPLLRGDGRLFIVAADHPARGSLAVGANPTAMADRHDLLERLQIALADPGVDGVLATADILDDLALLGVLDDKIVVGSMNRGGLRGASFELDDRYTGHDVPAMQAAGFDFAKALIRIDRDDDRTAPTLAATAQAVRDCAHAQLPLMLEPFLSHRTGSGVVNDLTPAAVIESVAIASGLGGTSAYSWLKLPVVDHMDEVMAATTLPTVLLGGDGGGDSQARFEAWRSALALPGVHGLTVGRTLLYPEDDQVGASVRIAADLVHPSTASNSEANEGTS